MPKVNLDEQYLWAGSFYGPGEVEVPDKLMEAYNLTPATKHTSKSTKTEEKSK